MAKAGHADEHDAVPVSMPALPAVSRRCFIAASGAVAAGAALASCTSISPNVTDPRRKEPQTMAVDLTGIPNLCTHEHWGSIDAIGTVSEGYRADVECGATPSRRVDLFDLLLDPYFHGHLCAAGDDPNSLARQAKRKDFGVWAREAPQDAFSALSSVMTRHALTGTYQCTRRGVQRLYGVDISDADRLDLAALNARIARNYADIFGWYRQTMQHCRFSGLIRPVHPEFYVREQSQATAKAEHAFTRTVMRIDPLLDLWRRDSPRRAGLAQITGVSPQDAGSWRAFLAKLFELAERNGAVGIKQLQAYTRTLEFRPRDDTTVTWIGDLDPDQVTAFKDWVVHECCRLANDRGWPHQIHVGTHNLEQSSPLPLGALAERYPDVKLVLLHCWPFLEESGWLAKYHRNIYLDTCWMPVLNPAFYREAMRMWLTYVPTSKIMCAHDSTSIEMAVGSSLFARELLGQALGEQAHALSLSSTALERVALDILHNNGAAVYGMSRL